MLEIYHYMCIVVSLIKSDTRNRPTAGLTNKAQGVRII